MNQEIAKATAPTEHSAPSIPTFSVQLSSTRRGARLARLLATEQLRSWGLPLEPANHLVAELAANAVTHAHVTGRDFRLALHLVGDTVRIEVTDTHHERLPELQLRAERDADSGRGLLLVDALADRWGVTQGPFPRKTVWAELRVTPPAPPAPQARPEPDSARSGTTGAFPQGT